ncbi:MAG: hypothetical protein ACRDD7_14540 [Peptostreptococcaceae bacterium]
MDEKKYYLTLAKDDYIKSKIAKKKNCNYCKFYGAAYWGACDSCLVKNKEVICCLYAKFCKYYTFDENKIN